MRIEKREIASSKELSILVKEALEGEIKGLSVIDEVALSSDCIEMGILAGDNEGRVFVVAAKEHSGDPLIMSFGSHIVWLKHNRDRLARAHPRFNWIDEPGVVLMAESFSPHTMMLASLLGVDPKMCLTMKCLGIGNEKGLYIERVELPEARLVRRPEAEAQAAPASAGAAESGAGPDDLLSRTVKNMVGIAEGLEVSASFGYRSKSLDWVPVANLRSHRGTIWIESGPGKWTTKRVENEASLGGVLDAVKKSYDDILKTKGGAKNAGDAELSDAERKSLSWE
jgi:hypothetical protein